MGMSFQVVLGAFKETYRFLLEKRKIFLTYGCMCGAPGGGGSRQTACQRKRRCNLLGNVLESFFVNASKDLEIRFAF